MFCSCGAIAASAGGHSGHIGFVWEWPNPVYGAGEDGRTVPVPGDRTLTLITLIEVGTAAIAELLHSDGVLSGVRVWCDRVCLGNCSRVIV